MKIHYNKSYDYGFKILKKKRKTKELESLNEILDIIRNSDNYDQLKANPIAYLYDFEELRSDKKGFASFNLSKSGGVIRLIVWPYKDKNMVEIVFISTKHYEDFNPKGVILYDE